MIHPQPTLDVVVGSGVYVTRSGHIAFVKASLNTSNGKMGFSGKMADRIDGKNLSRSLEWLPSGHCSSSNEDRDQIMRMA